MNKIYTLITLLVMAAVAGLSANAESLCLTLHFTGGDVAKFAISESPVMTFDGDKLTVRTSNNVEGIYDRSAVEHFDFSMGETVSIGELAADADYAVELSGTGLVRISGNNIHSAAAYNVAGRKVASATAANGIITLSVEEQPAGVYVIEIPGHPSFKLKK
ncbi:MAG: hypothetical protein NC189_02110 [Bacteroides sp.]|nr:hypothetical protein [Bacteroides sp.]